MMGFIESFGVIYVFVLGIAGDVLGLASNVIGFIDNGSALVVYAIFGIMVYLFVAWFIGLFKKSSK